MKGKKAERKREENIRRGRREVEEKEEGRETEEMKGGRRKG